MSDDQTLAGCNASSVKSSRKTMNKVSVSFSVAWLLLSSGLLV